MQPPRPAGQFTVKTKYLLIAKNQMSTVIDLKKMAGNVENIKVFQDRNEAIKWLDIP
jgi:hypothetical protein